MTRRLVERAFLLPFLGVFLLTPPVVLIVQAWGETSGLPIFIVYIFVVWIALIVLGGVVSTRLARLEDEAVEETGGAHREEAA